VLWKQLLRNISIVIIVTSRTVNADFSLRCEGDVFGSGEVGTTVGRNAPVIFYPRYSSKKPVSGKDQCIEDIQDVLFFSISLILQGIQHREAEAGGVGNGRGEPQVWLLW